MGQDRLLELSEEEMKELSIGLLRDWWIIATQAFVEKTSSEIALKALRPYFIHNGRYGGMAVRNHLGLDRDDGVGVGMVTSYGNYLMTKANCTSLLTKDGGIYTSTDCLTKGASPEACFCLCEYDGQGAVEAVNPEFQQDMIQNLARGYPECKWVLHRKGQSYRDTEPEVVFRAQDFVKGDEEDDYMTRGGLGEFWLMVTKAFIATSTKDVAIANLSPRLQKSGMDFGASHISETRDTENAIMMASGSISQLAEGFGIKHKVGKLTNGVVDCDILECPFSGTIPEICIQFESFCNGLCKAINPNLILSYDRMMTKGDKTCHWTISKKGSTARVGAAPTREDDSRTALKALAIKYAQGEITKHEYDELKKLIQGE